MTLRYLPAPGFLGQPATPPPGWQYAMALSNGPYRDIPGATTEPWASQDFDKGKVQDAARRAVAAGCSLLVLDTEHVPAWDAVADKPNPAYIAVLGQAVATVRETAPGLKVAACNPSDRPSGDWGQCEIQVLAPDPAWASRRAQYMRRAYLVAQAQYGAGLRVFTADTLYFGGDPHKREDIGVHLAEFAAFCLSMRAAFQGPFLPYIATRVAPVRDWRNPVEPFLTPWHIGALRRVAESFADGCLVWHCDFNMQWPDAARHPTIAALLGVGS